MPSLDDGFLKSITTRLSYNKIAMLTVSFILIVVARVLCPENQRPSDKPLHANMVRPIQQLLVPLAKVVLALGDSTGFYSRYREIVFWQLTHHTILPLSGGHDASGLYGFERRTDHL